MSANTDYSNMLKSLQAELLEVKAEKDKLEEKEIALDTAIDGLRDLVKLSQIETGGGEETSASPIAPTSKPYKEMSIIDSAIHYLHSVGESKKNKDLVDALLAGGFPSKAKDPYITIRSVIMREMKEHGSFTYNAQKEWGLPEWQKELEETERLNKLADEVIAKRGGN